MEKRAKNVTGIWKADLDLMDAPRDAAVHIDSDSDWIGVMSELSKMLCERPQHSITKRLRVPNSKRNTMNASR